jgi:hypothetical protein
MDGQRRWSVFVTVEGPGAEDYEPPLSDELQAALPADLAASVEFRPSVLDAGRTRHYRLEAGLTLTADDLARGLAGELARRIAHLGPGLTLNVEVREEGGDQRTQITVRAGDAGSA